MRDLVGSIEAEFRRYEALGEGALAQLADTELCEPGPGGTNPVAVLVRHVAGNLTSRFTDFLSADGEKPWRDRDGEFALRGATGAGLASEWERGWDVLREALGALTDADLGRTVTIRGVELPVHAALHRSLSHTSYHVGQIVHVARSLRGEAWRSLSIPPGGSKAYDRAPGMERPDDHAAALEAPRPAPREGR